MSADILQFPTANSKADRAFWHGQTDRLSWDGPPGVSLGFDAADRDAILRAGAVEIEHVQLIDPGIPSDSPYHAPDTDPA